MLIRYTRPCVHGMPTAGRPAAQGFHHTVANWTKLHTRPSARHVFHSRWVPFREPQQVAVRGRNARRVPYLLVARQGSRASARAVQGARRCPTATAPLSAAPGSGTCVGAGCEEGGGLESEKRHCMADGRKHRGRGRGAGTQYRHPVTSHMLRRRAAVGVSTPSKY